VKGGLLTILLTANPPAIPAAPVLPLVIGHRGAARCAPENTLAGLRRAKALDCRWVEFDVRLTADREPILLHDNWLGRTTDGRGLAVRLPLATLRRCDAGGWFAAEFAGEPIPTLAEAVTLLAGLELGANIELKTGRGDAADTGRVVAGALDRLWPPQLPAPLISSFLPEALSAARQRAPRFARGMLFRSVPKDWRERAETLGCASIHVDHRRLTPATVAEIRDSGYYLLAYTVNEPARARALLSWGVTSVFSDVPHIILAVLGSGSRQAAAGGAAIWRQGTVA
jgi:glycerophosphoryl diester phosphodiesterase